jgi:hypothetical protein
MGGKGKSEVGGTVNVLLSGAFNVAAPINKVDNMRAMFINTISSF